MAVVATPGPWQSNTELVEAHEQLQLPLRQQSAPGTDNSGGDGSATSSNSFVNIEAPQPNNEVPAEMKSRPGLLRSHSALNPGQRKSFDQRTDTDTRVREADSSILDHAPEFGMFLA